MAFKFLKMFVVVFLQLSVFSQAIAKPDPRVVHVLVALCDNENHGIVPVPAALGNGRDPRNNLYWGAAYGVKTVFKRSPDWKLLSTVKSPKPDILERLVFHHERSNTYLIADAYAGDRIKNALIEFVGFSQGMSVTGVSHPEDSGEAKLMAGAAADLLVYIGHNGLMDFSIGSPDASQAWTKVASNLSAVAPAKSKRDAIVLACYSRDYFKKLLSPERVRPLVWSTGLMAPEAYILEAALKGWVKNESALQISLRAAQAYHRYQKCGLRAAKNLLVSGW